MDGPRLQNLIGKGSGVAARRLGSPFAVYRPRGPCQPLSSRNRIVTLSAAFGGRDDLFRRPVGYNDAVWTGVFDSLYTRPGDYLSGSDPCGRRAVYFVAAQQPLLPVQCVKTNRIVCVARPPAPATGGYGGMVAETALPVIETWPASLLSLSARVSGSLPEAFYGSWSLLLPALPADVLVGDIVTDDLGRTFLTAASEASDLGWRLVVKQVAG